MWDGWLLLKGCFRERLWKEKMRYLDHYCNARKLFNVKHGCLFQDGFSCTDIAFGTCVSAEGQFGLAVLEPAYTVALSRLFLGDVYQLLREKLLL